MAETIRVTQGTDWSRPLLVRNSLGDPTPDLLDSDVLSARLWAGDDLGSTASPSVAWEDDDPSTSTARLTIAKEDIAGLAPGTYRLLVTLSRGSTVVEILKTDVEVAPGPGSGTAPAVYAPYQQMQVLYPGIGGIQARSDQSGFAEQRAEAREWVDDLIVDAYPAADKSAIRGWLDDDRLAVTTKVRRMATLKALAIVLAPQLGDQASVAAGRKSGAQQAGLAFLAEAQAIAATLIAEIDSDGDGIPDVTVDVRPPDVVEATASASRAIRYGTLRARSWRRPCTEC